ncbi:MAG: cyclopropane fatty acyl phospholipid synthase [Proteobacteria bacterium]|nr:cyclopropane fatty acyl phospholipid synthase [Pseudomonadota bacterium]
MSDKMKKTVERLFAMAGIEVDGKNPWDIKVHDPRFYRRVLSDGILGIGESYMDGDWDCEQLDEAVNRAFHSDLYNRMTELSWHDKLQGLQARLMNMQSKRRSHEVGQAHYDNGNELYEAMLGKRMVYSCGYWRAGAHNLDEAQEAKLDLVCRKVGLKESETVLDIGSGWGSFLIYAAEKYGIKGTGLTVSKEQKALANEKSEGLSVETLIQDYREPILDAGGSPRLFDHIVSIGMVEHVGPKNYRIFMEVVDKHLKPGGLFLLHVIGQPTSVQTNDPWTHKYIFPNSQAPSMTQLAEASEGIFHIEDIHTFGTDYEPTLLAWHKNFNDNWDTLKEFRNEDGSSKYDDRFFRMWNYYLLGATGLARSQKADLWQIVFSRGDIPGGYRAIRL